ncbi:MAG: hypothetical protein K0S65_1347 [Labilithrix sp.]|nr:hypothetical protein [Labilithrix sp.]
MVRRAVWMALAACLWLLGLPSVANAASTVCIVRVGQPSDTAVLQRIIGQTSDLPLTILAVPGAVEQETSAAREQGLRLARSHDARAVVWFSPLERIEHDEIAVFLLDPVEQRLFTARVGRDAGSRSAMLEATSLIVRDVLQSLLEGRPIDAAEEVLPESGKHEAAAPPPLVGIKPKPEPLPSTASPTSHAPWTPFTGVGVRAVLTHEQLSYALNSRVGIAHGSWEGGAALTLGATNVQRDPVASLLLRRHTVGLFAGGRLELGEGLTLTLGVQSGAIFFLRSTRPHVSYLAASASEANVRAYIGPEIRLTWAPRPSGVRLSFGAGCDLVVFPPAFAYERTSARAPTFPELALWPVQPHLTVELGLAP